MVLFPRYGSIWRGVVKTCADGVEQFQLGAPARHVDDTLFAIRMNPLRTSAVPVETATD